MKILIVGSGGREHAIAASVAKSPKAEKIYCAPGNAGIAQLAECVPIGAMEFDRLTEFAKEKEIDLVIVGMDDPLVGGLVDQLEEKAHLKGQKVQKYQYIGLWLFVAIPLPGTGAWTGSLAAAFLDMRLKNALPAVVLGVLTAGCIMLGLTHMGINLFSGAV